MFNDADLVASAQYWIDSDPHRPTQVVGQALLDSGQMEVIREHFGNRLNFGTAGLRGEMGPGPNRMNHLTVRRAAYAFAHHLINSDTNIAQLGIVIGFDARHGSSEFAIETARVFGALNLPTYLYDDCQPTPVIAHAITHLGAAGGVIVTASHNPPKDNGYKVYWGNGAQIIPPHDVRIGALIDAVDVRSEIAVADLDTLKSKGLVRPVPPEVRSSYFEEILAERVSGKAADIRVVYTAMHGVGYKTISEALLRAGYNQHVKAPHLWFCSRRHALLYKQPEYQQLFRSHVQLKSLQNMTTELLVVPVEQGLYFSAYPNQLPRFRSAHQPHQ